MKIKRKNIPCILFVLCCAAFAAYVLLTREMWDHDAPELTIPETALQLSVYAGEEELLRGVTASDERDGDVSDLTVVESVSDIYDRNKATVTYAAFDRSGNVSKGQRTLEYTDYTGPRFTLKGPLIFREGSYFDVFDVIGAADVIDGVLDGKVKGVLLGGGDFLEKAGMYQVEFRVTNSLGDTIHLNAPVEIYAHSEPASQIHLEQYLVYLKQDTPFRPMDYVAPDSWGRPMDVDSDVDTSQPGCYSVTYTDRDGEIYGKTRLLVVVEE